METVLIGLGTSVCGGLFVLILQFGIKKIQIKTSPLTGRWENRIKDQQGEIVKVDELKVQQRGVFLFGKINRKIPEDQDYREWKFRGYRRGESIIAIFWSTNINVKSYGAWHVRHVSDSLFSGFYLSLVDNQEIQAIPLDFVKTS